MKRAILTSALVALVDPAIAEPVDMTGSSCTRTKEYVTWTWEFYGDVAMRYAQDGSRSRLLRIGKGAYEKYGLDGEWSAIYYFFDSGDGIQVRILARPGLIVRENDPRAPLEVGIFPLNGECEPIGKQP